MAGTSVTALLLVLFRRIFRIDIYSRFDAYVISALIVGSFWQLCWSSFAAITVQYYVAGTSWIGFVVLYVLAFVSCYVAFLDVSLFYQGHIYRLVNALLALISFVVFSFWPRLGRVLFGWVWGSVVN